MTLRWFKTSEVSANHGVKILVYGEAGTGKTTLMTTLPNPVIGSAESGLLSIRKHNLHGAHISNVADLREFYNYCAGSAEARKNFQSVCLDSVSEIGEQVLSTAKANSKDPRQAYGELIDVMTKILKDFRDLPGYHVYFSAKMEKDLDQVSGMSRYCSSMPGSKLGPQLPYLFDEVFRARIHQSPPTQDNPEGQITHYLQTRGDMQTVAKDRSGELALYEQPHLGNIINKILGVQS